MWPHVEGCPATCGSLVNAAGTSYRLDVALDLAALPFVHIAETDQDVGERLNLSISSKATWPGWTGATIRRPFLNSPAKAWQ
ncbi:hypothetical protein KFZ76_15825 [Methylovulum psychrotolerans]|uniref:hypothetical protein n=1 Tax=Methylovulum psychrotolerans TaxID=1704499 RepID=UPI001BFF183C|nr:hypothetical protein [Methylovulum psychrotolerans]MBT9099162.1 hypothetical protein [Methylovulum psychrotolerans]